MDSLALKALVREWKEKYAGARVDRIHQPGDRTLVLTVRQVGTHRLVLSAERGRERAHTLFFARPDNPVDPPMFCMLARKHLVGGRIRDIRQYGWDRVLDIVVDTVDELGDTAVFTLTLELMGKHSNLILCRADAEGNPDRIVDAIVRVPSDLSRVRQVLPGLAYVRPPAQERPAIDRVTRNDLERLAGLPADDAKEWTRALMRAVAGVGPVTAREVWARVSAETGAGTADPEQVVSTLEILARASALGLESACVGLDELGRVTACAPFRLSAYERHQGVSSFDEALARFAQEHDAKQALTGQKANLVRALTDQLDRLRGKRTKLEAELEHAEDHESLRIMGELLTAYAHQVDKGASQVTLENFYDDNRPMTIPLDPSKSATQNAQAYFKRASKRKRALTLAADELALTLADIAYLESCLLQAEDADAEQLPLLREELVEQGFLKPSPRRGGNKAQRAKHRSGRPQFAPYTFRSSDGWSILVGRSNQQNDRLTLRQSRPQDIWMHVRDQPGSHVVIRRQSETVPERTLREAAMLAAYYSKARDSSNVAVDYTDIRHVWKPNGARPGHVLYNQQRTLFVTPDRSQVGLLLEQIGQPSNK
ncbi:Rqc2 family fibronectin-binding protein [Alicyclobacillus kakegawensis]|uniref:Rqc2 family fibronectin-binding protein n=1 Tax=Alicyclobacillus kakegawensis TaxID=392012 RepID=UPI000829B68E|nr:NFACT family protein [Alicyclobacillus kakegawensis]